MSREGPVTGRVGAPGRIRPSFYRAWDLILGGLRSRSWVWRLSMLWVVMGAGGAIYALVCTMYGCTTNQCTNDEFWFPYWNGEPRVVGAVGNLAETAWVLMAVPLLVAGFVRLRGWQRRNWVRAAAWAGAWVAALVLMVAIAVAGAWGADFPGLGWGEFELPIFAGWVALGVVMTSVLVKLPGREQDPARSSLAKPARS